VSIIQIFADEEIIRGHICIRVIPNPIKYVILKSKWKGFCKTSEFSPRAKFVIVTLDHEEIGRSDVHKCVVIKSNVCVREISKISKLLNLDSELIVFQTLDDEQIGRGDIEMCVINTSNLRVIPTTN